MNNYITINLIQRELLNECPTINYVNDETARRMWWSSLEVIQKEFLPHYYQEGGLWVASPLPALNEKKYLSKFAGWLWAPEGFPYFKNDQGKFLPHSQSQINSDKVEFTTNYRTLNLHSHDGFEPFLMIITPNFQCILTISGEKDKKNLVMRCDEMSLKKVIRLVDIKLSQGSIDESMNFKNKLNTLGELSINKEFMKNFWPYLSIQIAKFFPSFNVQTSYTETSNKSLQITEAKLLAAISHEVRTPLTTIRTLISSTLKNYKMDQIIRNRLIQIDNECTEQIDRFGLIFNAAELVNSESSSLQSLTSIDLGEILKKLSPNWQYQLERRGINLQIDIPNELPEVLSNSEKLELMLGGLIDKNTRGLKEGSILILELRPAGQKLKLQLIVQQKDMKNKKHNLEHDGSDIGPVLNWDPQTGSLNLSQSATQKLLASLGGRLTKRKNSGLTVFFPIADFN